MSRVLAPRATLLLAVLAAACGGDATAARPSAILITLDTTRADALGCYGAKAGATPNLDRLAAEGILFEHAFASAPITLPSHASMLTGLTPLRHGVRNNSTFTLPPEATTLAELARDAGHETAAFVSSLVLDASFGLAQGFELYDAPERPTISSSSHFGERDARETIGRALAWLEKRDRSRPFFLWVHLFDPHGPYDPPRELGGGDPPRELGGGSPPRELLRGNSPHELYLGEVAHADRELGRLFDALRDEGVLDEASVLVAADHGEAFGEHDEYSHAVFLWQTTLAIPFLLRLPGGARAGERALDVVSGADIAPTLLAAMELAVPVDLDGRSLLAGAPEARPAYFESYDGHLAYGWSPMAGLADGRFKYVHSSEPQLFDLAKDPLETTNLLPLQSAAARPYVEALGELATRTRLRSAAVSAGATMDQALSDVGYVVSHWDEEDLPDPLEPSPLPSPAGQWGTLRDLLYAQELVNRASYDEALAILRRVSDAQPMNLFAQDRLGRCLMESGRALEAIAPLTRVVQSKRAWPGTYFNLGVCLREKGDLGPAIDCLVEARRRDPGTELFLTTLVETLRMAGRDADADRYEKQP